MQPLTRLIREPFFRASGIVFTGSVAANALNYLFNLAAGRLLAPQGYGEAATLVTLAMIVSIPAATLSTLLAKYVPQLKAHGRREHAALIFRLAQRSAWVVGIIFMAALLIASPWMGRTLRLTLLPLMLFSALLPINTAAAAVKGALQGEEQFSSFSAMAVIEAGGKLALTLVFFALGLALPGVVLALVASSAAAYLYGIIRNILQCSSVYACDPQK